MSQQADVCLDILNGWKEIANYLGKGVRTVQRYERQLGLPVRRPSGKSTGSVIATKAELYDWVSASLRKESFPLPQHDPNNSALLSEFSRLVAEMNRLRRETAQLGLALQSNLWVLKNNPRFAVPGTAEPENAPVHPPLESLALRPRSRVLRDVMTFDPMRKKQTVSGLHQSSRVAV